MIVKSPIFIGVVLLMLLVYPAAGMIHASSHSPARSSTQAFDTSAGSSTGASETGMQQIVQSLSASSIKSQIDLVATKAQESHVALNTAQMNDSLMNAYSLLNDQGSFVALIVTHGASSFSWGIGDDFSGNIGPTAGFIVSWTNDSTNQESSWTMYLDNGSIAGPFTIGFPAQVEKSANWAGYDFYQCCNGALLDAFATVNTPTIENPPAGQIYGNGIHVVASVWVGISPDSNGGGGLIQTGYGHDVTAGGHYQFWYQNPPAIQYEQYYTAGECGNGRTYANPGDSVQEYVGQNGNNNEFQIYDSTSDVVCTASYTHAETPYYAEAIVEAFSICQSGHLNIQQIAELSTTTTFGSGYIDYASGQPGGELESWNFLHSNGWYITSILQQSSSTTQNIQDSYSSTAGGPQMTWQNSDYNYNWVGNPGQAC
jgi:hypothetical protein